MKKIFSILIILSMLAVFCSCGEPDVVTDPATEVATQHEDEPDASEQPTQNTNEDVSAIEPSESENTTGGNTDVPILTAGIPVVEEYTLTAKQTENKNNFTFAGEKVQTQTCNKIVMVNDDGATELAVSFAEDGSALTVYTLEPDGDRFTTLAQFDVQGRLTGIFNGSGSYSIYTYSDNTCVLEAFDAQETLLDKRTYYYNDDDLTERVERSDAQGVYETYYYTYTAEGMTESMRVENQTGYILYNYSYNEDNNLSSLRIEQNNQFYGIQEYTYDEHDHRATYTFRNDENAPHPLDMTVNYSNTYAEDGAYLGTAEVDSVTGDVYIAVAYDYIQTDYPHYAEFIQSHFATY